MNFNGTKPIYFQIADLICDKIVDGDWLEGDRISSVREMGSELEVNPNTVMRAYEWLADHNIIYNKRGVGFFINSDALNYILKDRREQLLNNDLRDIAKQMKQLGISKDEILIYIDKYLG